MRSDRLRSRRLTAGWSTGGSFMDRASPRRPHGALRNDPDSTLRSAWQAVLEDLAGPVAAGEADGERLGAGEALLLVPLHQSRRAGPAVPPDEPDPLRGRLLVGPAHECPADVLARVGA